MRMGAKIPPTLIGTYVKLLLIFVALLNLLIL
jgi:hypothetical protein